MHLELYNLTPAAGCLDHSMPYLQRLFCSSKSKVMEENCKVVKRSLFEHRWLIKHQNTILIKSCDFDYVAFWNKSSPPAHTASSLHYKFETCKACYTVKEIRYLEK